MDLFTHRCGCGRILGKLEQCVSCTDKRRAEAIMMAGPKEQFFKWDPPTAKLVEMVKDIQPYREGLARRVAHIQDETLRLIRLQFASPEDEAMARETTALYQAARVQRRR